MKKICFYVLISLGIISCTKDNGTSSGGSSITSISGKIDSWTSGSDKILKAGFYYTPSDSYYDEFIPLDSSSIDINGNFNLTSLSAPTAKYLMSLDSMLSSSSSSTDFKASNHLTKTLMNDLHFEVFSKVSGETVGSIQKLYEATSDSTSAGDFHIGYVYVDRDVSVTGTRTESDGSYTYTSTANLSLKAGWNKIVNKVISKSYTKETETISGNEPAGAKWIFSSGYKK